MRFRFSVRTTANLAAVALVAALLAGCWGAAEQGRDTPADKENPPALSTDVPAEAPVEVKPLPGYLAPEISGVDVFTKEKVSLSDLRGQLVMINFWATWCGPCRLEMPDMQKLYGEAQGNLRILAVGADNTESPDQLAGFARELGLTFPIVHDGGEAARTYRAFGLPTTVFVDPNGIVRIRHMGLLTLDQMRQLLASTEEMGKQE